MGRNRPAGKLQRETPPPQGCNLEASTHRLVGKPTAAKRWNTPLPSGRRRGGCFKRSFIAFKKTSDQGAWLSTLPVRFNSLEASSASRVREARPPARSAQGFARRLSGWLRPASQGSRKDRGCLSAHRWSTCLTHAHAHHIHTRTHRVRPSEVGRALGGGVQMPSSISQTQVKLREQWLSFHRPSCLIWAQSSPPPRPWPYQWSGWPMAQSLQRKKEEK